MAGCRGAIFLLYLIFGYSETLQMKPQFYESNHETCEKLARNPYFDINMVVGEPWRIYYTWNLRLGSRCLDMVFKNATRQIVDRIWSDMADYLEQQPVWEAATVHLSMGTAKHELLLFADQGAAGNFLAVANVIQDGNITPMKNGVPLLKFLIKLIHDGRFLLVMDCQVGGATLSARYNTPPKRSEIEFAASALQIGEGFHACTEEESPSDRFLF